jgi:hypothetical protein
LDRRQFFKLAGAAGALAVPPAAMTEALASLAPKALPDPFGAWLPLDGASIPVNELSELANLCPHWTKDGMLTLPNMVATVNEVENFLVPSHGVNSYQSAQVASRIIQKVLPIRYMIKARKDDAGDHCPMGMIVAFAG